MRWTYIVSLLARSISITALILSIPLLILASVPQELPKGEVIKAVVCKENSKQSYSLYIPTLYSPDKRWPVLYCFDPGARGITPVERFKEAGEKYGWIIAGSNNSRNGPLDQTVMAAAAMAKDVQSRFAINMSRVYAAGFSGGARAASSLAFLCKGCIVGVIACGAGLPADTNPSANMPFVLFATIGIDDFNYPELKSLDQELDKYSVTHRVQVYEGGHEWATTELCLEAVEWMEVQGMRIGSCDKDEKIIESLWQKSLNRAMQLEQSNNILDAYSTYKAMLADFKQLREIAELEKKTATLKESKELKKALKEEQQQFNKQQEKIQQLITLKERLSDQLERPMAMSELKSEVGKLRKASTTNIDTGDRRIARRTLRLFLIGLFESALFRYQAEKKFAEAALNLEIAAEIVPENPQIYYELAAAYALNGEKKRAIETLKRAVEKGFKDLAAINNNQAFELLRKEKAYQQIIESLAPLP
ncbi:MAG: tetratricopeptide repeat protein [Acidobacteriota bacterium]